jgi:PAS domain S-box-containing protein
MNENTERMLRLSHFTLETAADGIFWADAEGRIQRVNEATCRMHGYSRDELLTMRAHDLSLHLSEETNRAQTF